MSQRRAGRQASIDEWDGYIERHTRRLSAAWLLDRALRILGAPGGALIGRAGQLLAVRGGGPASELLARGVAVREQLRGAGWAAQPLLADDELVGWLYVEGELDAHLLTRCAGPLAGLLAVCSVERA